MSFSVDGIISGLNTTDIINQLMSAERIPVNHLEDDQKGLDNVAAAWRDIGTRLGTFSTALNDLTAPTKISPLAATSSDTSIVAATAGSTATAGATTFRVTQLASSHQLASVQTFADGTASIGTGTAVLAAGLSKLGGTAVSVDAAFASGNHTLRFQALPGGQVNAVLDNDVVFLGTVSPSSTVTINSPQGGSVTVDVGASGLSDGTVDLQVVRPTGGTLNDLVAGINGGVAARAQLLNPSGTPGSTQLVLTGVDSGTAGALTLDLSGFAGLSSTSEIRAAQDATITLGTLTVTRSSNTVTDLIPGVTLNLAKADPAKDVTLTVAQDTDAVVTRMKSFVTALNGVLQNVKDLTGYNADTKKAGLLIGDSTVRSVASRLTSAIQGAVATTGTVRTLSQMGLSFQTTGVYGLDESKLRAALASDPDAMKRLFSNTGAVTGTSLASFSAAASTVAPSTGAGYDFTVTQAAEQATLGGAAFVTLGAADTISVQLGTASPVSFVASSGATPDAVAAGLNTLFQAKGMGVQAAVNGGAIRLTTTGYGSGAKLTVTSTGDTGLNGMDTGVDVAGTMDGVAATGSGQLLTGATALTKGLSVTVTATPATLGSGISGQVTYAPGAGSTLTRTLASLQGAGGTVDNATSSASSQSKALGLRIDDWNDRLAATEQRYRTMFANLETTLGQLKNQSSWLTSQLSALAGYR